MGNSNATRIESERHLALPCKLNRPVSDSDILRGRETSAQQERDARAFVRPRLRAQSFSSICIKWSCNLVHRPLMCGFVYTFQRTSKLVTHGDVRLSDWPIPHTCMGYKTICSEYLVPSTPTNLECVSFGEKYEGRWPGDYAAPAALVKQQPHS